MNIRPWLEVQAIIPPLAPANRAALAASIERDGVRVPVMVLPDGRIIDGWNRWELSGGTAPVEVLDLPEAQAFELALTLNAARRQLGPEQQAAIRAAWQQHRDDLRKRAAELRQQGMTQQQTADELGMSRRTIDAWEEPDSGSNVNGHDVDIISAPPDLRIRIPRTEHDRIYERVRDGETRERVAADYYTSRERIGQIVRQVERRRAEPATFDDVALPTGVYRCLVIDPPWPMVKIEREERPDQGDGLDYPVMTLAAIQAKLAEIIDVAAVKDGCHVYLWTTHRFLPDAFALFDALGVRYQCLMTWVKPTGITPYSWMYNTEHVLFGRLGSLPLERLGLKLSFAAPVERHSAKPEAFYDLVRQASPERRLDVFARKPREGFDVWGNEVPQQENASGQEVAG